MGKVKVSLFEQNQWEAGPGEDLAIPEAYVTGLKYEIVVLTEKKAYTFRCADYEPMHEGANAWRCIGVIIDTSKRNPKGEVTLKRLSYHPEVTLANVPFMAIPAPENWLEDAGT